MYPIPDNATRIRYLESTGTQYVDTGVKIGSSFSVNGEFAAAESSTQFVVGQSDTSSSFALAAAASGKWIYDRGNLNSNRISSTASVVVGRKTNVSIGGNTLVVDGVSNTGASVSFSAPAYNAIVFGWANSSSSRQLGKVRVYSCSIYDGTTLVRDFVPVRVGQTGYLFDRVSGQLFGNAGTGDFVLGPDTFAQGVVPTRMMAMGVRKKKVWPTPLYTGVNLVGSSVQNNNGILSGFTGSSYAKMPFYWTSGASQIEAVCKFHSTGANSEEGIWGCVGSADAFTPFYHLSASDKAGFGAFLSTNGTTWSAVPYSTTYGTVTMRYQSGSYANPAAGDYVLKFVQENGMIRAYAWSGSAWTKHSEASLGTIYGAANLVPQLGTNRGSNNPFQGTIDLNYTYLYRDGELWWEGAAGAYKNVKTTYSD